jgi:hypothetical protein
MTKKKLTASQMGKIGGKIGGRRRALYLTTERKQEIARMGAAARWAKPTGQKS